MQGKIKWFNKNKGFGFIETDQGQDIFLHHSDIINNDVSCIEDGLSVHFDVQEAESGPTAKNIRFDIAQVEKMPSAELENKI